MKLFKSTAISIDKITFHFYLLDYWDGLSVSSIRKLNESKNWDRGFFI